MIILLPQLLGFAILYPGVYGYDAGFHILQYVDQSVALTSHFSVLYTLYLGSFVAAGISFNNPELGFALAMLIQALVLCAIAWKASLQAYRLSKNTAVFVTAVLFFAIFPLGLVMRLSSSQDVFFAGFFLLLFVELSEVPRKHRQACVDSLANDAPAQ